MRQLVTTMVLAGVLSSAACQEHLNVKNGLAIEGYDAVSYFDGKAEEGEKRFKAIHEGATYYFVSAPHQRRFESNPVKYIPAYGGWCAYAMGTSGDKVSVDPETFEIRDGKLYLFYNQWFTNTLESWQKEGPEKLREVADRNWMKYSP